MADEEHIETIADFERVLDEDPDARERIRRKLLTDEERDLPRIVESLAGQISRLTEAVTEGFTRMTEEQAGMREEVEAVQKSVKSLHDGQHNIRGLLLEQTASRWLVPRIAQDMGLRRTRVLKSLDHALPETVEDLLDEAVETGAISARQADAVKVSDLIISGIRRRDQTTLYVVTEVSGTLNRNDISRAKERSATLGKATRTTAIATVAATVIREPQRLHAERENVEVYRLESR